MATWWRQILVAVTAPAFVGCGGGAPVPPPSPPVQERPRCPLPLVQGAADGPVPVRLRVENESGEPLSIYLDSCTGHLLAGDVPPGGTGLFRLPRVLYPYRGSLRIHAYRPQPSERYDSFLVPIGADPVVSFRLSEDSESALVVEPDRPVTEEPIPLTGAPGEPVQVHVTNGVSYASGWSSDHTVVISWLCDGDGLRAHLAGPPMSRLRGPVALSADAYAPSFEAEWELEEGMAPSIHVVGPPARALAAVASSGGLSVTVRGGGGTSYEGLFPLEDLRPALALLPCYD